MNFIQIEPFQFNPIGT